MSNPRTRKFGYIKSKPDERDLLIRFTKDHVRSFKLRAGVKPTEIFDLRNIVKLPQALSEIDQGTLGSCTANAIAFAYAFSEIKQSNKEIFLPSRLFIYYNERLIEGTINEDAGAQIRTGIKSINKFGVCDEHHWIYDPLKFRVKPPQEVYDEANKAKPIKYARIDFRLDRTLDDRINHLKKALKSGYPFIFGFTVFESFMSEQVSKTGIVNYPTGNENSIGGHAVCAVGYDDIKKSFIIKNSWGSKWGLNGYFYMPYNYVANPNLSDDFWIIQEVTNPDIDNFKPEDINPISVNLDIDISSGGVVHN
ncbi:cathepsin B cystein protease [Moumouvirus australiensis]|uniref:Cathepsin B cystein protease n=1 Tax=Moumouvirus australiensis TaxID=2109587 RepID=A0A2P1ELG2_9VIRU|nr:cathepsin B cystein protease [Moumouvirus australiensis]AVL94723.1 cathepsin B cystein protease [Moumouvirus australiensis]